MPLNLPSHQISPSSVEVSAFLAAPLVHPPTVKRFCRSGCQGSWSLWWYCTTWVTLNWRPPSCTLALLSPIRLRPPHLSSSYIHQAVSDFDVAMRETLEAILGGALSEWSWLKASLPSSLGGFNLRSASFHAPAAFLASSSWTQALVRRMLSHPPSRSPHIESAVAALSNSTSLPDWQCL